VQPLHGQQQEEGGKQHEVGDIRAIEQTGVEVLEMMQW